MKHPSAPSRAAEYKVVVPAVRDLEAFEYSRKTNLII
jgi:hypothetical protein